MGDYIMGYNEKMFGLGSKRSIIREIFEYSKTRAAEIGAENVYDFSLGNPSVPAPKEVNEVIAELLSERDSVLLHGYTSAQGDASVRHNRKQYQDQVWRGYLSEPHIHDLRCSGITLHMP